MKIKALFTLFVVMTFSLSAFAQSIPQGIYIGKSTKILSSVHILELKKDRFYTYSLPAAVTQILIKTGTYSISDTILTLRIDTSASFSLNILRLNFMHVNCDSPFNMVFNKISRSISFEIDYMSNSKYLIELKLASDDKLASSMQSHSGFSLGQIRDFLKQNPVNGIEVCNN